MNKKYISKGLLQDKNAAASKKGEPFFIRKEGEKVYTGFPLIPETETDGFTYGAITDFLEPDSEVGCEFGDGYVQAPDGTRAGLVWQVSNDKANEIAVLAEPDEERWGVYAVTFPKPMKSLDDLIFNFKAILPLIKTQYDNMINYKSKKIEPKLFFCPCCGYKTLEEKPPGTYEICSICFWEDDNVQFNDPNYKGGANGVSLYEARKNFKEFGASEKRVLEYVRKPTKYDMRNIDWKSLGYPLDL